MIILEATNEQREYVKKLMSNRAGWSQRFINNAGDKNREIGFLGQVVVSDQLHLKRPISKGNDGGFDIVHNGIRWDVKTELRTVDFRPHFAHNVLARQMGNHCDGFAFLSYNRKNGLFTFCGLILKEDFLEKAEFYPEGSPRMRDDGGLMVTCEDTWELSDCHLRKGSRETLINQAVHIGNKEESFL